MRPSALLQQPDRSRSSPVSPQGVSHAASTIPIPIHTTLNSPIPIQWPLGTWSRIAIAIRLAEGPKVPSAALFPFFFFWLYLSAPAADTSQSIFPQLDFLLQIRIQKPNPNPPTHSTHPRYSIPSVHSTPIQIQIQPHPSIHPSIPPRLPHPHLYATRSLSSNHISYSEHNI